MCDKCKPRGVVTELMVKLILDTSEFEASMKKVQEALNANETPDAKVVRELCMQVAKTYREKNADYGNSVEKGFVKYGPKSLLMRLEDKFNRLESLLNKPKEHQMVKSESIEDTLIDMAGYAIIGAMLLRKHREGNGRIKVWQVPTNKHSG